MSSTSWKRDFASGLIILVPILVSSYVIAWLYSVLAGTPFLAVIDPDLLAAMGIPGEFTTLFGVLLTLVVFVLLVFSVGYLMRTTSGDVVESALDGLMNRVPGLRVIYNASKMAVETAVSGTEDLQTPVKIETWEGLRMTAFKTGKTTDDGREVLFLPTAPNITTGFVVEVESDRYTEVDENVEDALTRILSAGFGESRQERGIPIDVTDELSVGESSDGSAPGDGD